MLVRFVGGTHKGSAFYMSKTKVERIVFIHFKLVWCDKGLYREMFFTWLYTEPTKLTKQIEEITNYQIRKQNLEDEILRLKKSNQINKEKKN